jgi:hypothetical protein
MILLPRLSLESFFAEERLKRNWYLKKESNMVHPANAKA